MDMINSFGFWLSTPFSTHYEFWGYFGFFSCVIVSLAGIGMGILVVLSARRKPKTYFMEANRTVLPVYKIKNNSIISYANAKINQYRPLRYKKWTKQRWEQFKKETQDWTLDDWFPRE
jgi:hypothetical protein